MHQPFPHLVSTAYCFEVHVRSKSNGRREGLQDGDTVGGAEKDVTENDAGVTSEIKRLDDAESLPGLQWVM